VALGVAETVAADVKARLAAWPAPLHLVEGERDKRDAFKAASVALACSGTVSTELAGAGCPVVVAYRLDPLSHQLVKRIATTRLFTLFNIAAGEAVAPELIQGQCSAPKLAAALAPLLDDPALRAQQVRRQHAALERMGRVQGDPSARAARAVLEVLQRAAPRAA